MQIHKMLQYYMILLELTLSVSMSMKFDVSNLFRLNTDYNENFTFTLCSNFNLYLSQYIWENDPVIKFNGKCFPGCICTPQSFFQWMKSGILFNFLHRVNCQKREIWEADIGTMTNINLITKKYIQGDSTMPFYSSRFLSRCQLTNAVRYTL